MKVPRADHKKLLALLCSVLVTSCAVSGDGVDLTSTASSGGAAGDGVKKIFMTASFYTGNLGGVAGADAKCMADANKPAGGGTYKALIGTAARQAPATDWPLQASTSYYRGDGTTLIGTTSAGRVFVFPLTNSISTPVQTVWTGIIGINWTLDAANNCNGWTEDADASNGTRGWASSTSSVAIDLSAPATSSTTLPIYCVEQ